MRSVEDRKTDGAIAFHAQDLRGQKIKEVVEVEGTDRDELILVFESGRMLQISCDPVRHDEYGVPFSQDHPNFPDPNTSWEVVLYDIEDTEAGRELKR